MTQLSHARARQAQKAQQDQEALQQRIATLEGEDDQALEQELAHETAMMDPATPVEVTAADRRKTNGNHFDTWKTATVGSGRRKGLQILALRNINKTPAEIQKRLGISRGYYYLLCKRLKTSGQWVEDSVERLDRTGVPMAVDNVLHGLEKRDRRYTLEVLKGRGVLNPKEDEGKKPGQQVLMVKIELPSGGQVVAATGSIVGVPNIVEEGT